MLRELSSGLRALDRIRLPMAVDGFLPLAVEMTKAVEELHGWGRVHGDIRPANIELCPNGAVSLLGPACDPSSKEVLESSLPYASPERTGRTNRPVDARSDLYSLGVTFYELLAGRWPLTANDPVGWLHAHVARAPLRLTDAAPRVPEAVSRVVHRLLAKSPEDRYQTAAGLRLDLERCASEWQALGGIAPFLLGAGDRPDRLLLPKSVYGRDVEAAALRAAFDRMVATGQPAALLVSGPAGIGKSSLVQQLRAPVRHRGGLFATGRFERREQHVPYGTIAGACRTLVREALAESEESVARWRELLVEALGRSGRVIADLIPDVLALVGELPPAPALQPTEAEVRLLRMFRRFLGVFARVDHPAALVLEDLQWADEASLRLLVDLVTDPETPRYLLLVGTYRDDEVDFSRRLAAMLERAQSEGAVVDRIALGPLPVASVSELIADAVRQPPQETAALARLVHARTGGNPLFAIHLLGELARRGLLAIEPKTGQWRWSMERIAVEGFTDNLVDLMIGKLKRLPRATQDVLSLAACAGLTVDSGILASASARSPQEVENELAPALEEQLLLPVDGIYRFAHDRVRDAAYALLTPPDRAATHLRIGSALLARTPPAALGDAVFAVVGQMNLGWSRIESEDERFRVADLNLLAGNRANQSGAHASATRFFAAGASLLDERAWEIRHELVFQLEIGRAACAFFDGELVQAEAMLDAIGRRVKDEAEAAQVTSLVLGLHLTKNRSDKAVEAGIAFLERVGIWLAPRPSREDVDRKAEELWRAIGTRPIGALADLPRMTDPVGLATMAVLRALLVPALNMSIELVYLLPIHMTLLSLEKGNCEDSCYGYAILAAYAGPETGDFGKAAELGRLAVDLMDRGVVQRRASVCHALAHTVAFWTQNIRVVEELLRRAAELALDAGEVLDVCYAAYGRISAELFGGTPLAGLLVDVHKALELVRAAQVPEFVDVALGQRCLVETLLGNTARFGHFSREDFDEAGFEESLAERQALQPLASTFYFTRKVQARFFSGDYRSALEAVANAEVCGWSNRAFSERVELAFYSAMAAAALHDEATPEERLGLRQRVFDSERQLSRCADAGPENFVARHALVAAELSRIDGDLRRAASHYDRAIQAALGGGFVHIAAMAYETASRFHRAEGAPLVADTYLTEALGAYARWGAAGKVRDLERAGVPRARRAEFALPADQLDLLPVLRASQSISREIDPEHLQRRLLHSLLEAAGARSARLVLVRGEDLELEAEAITPEKPERPIYVRLTASEPISTGSNLPSSILNYVRRTRQRVVLDDAREDAKGFGADPYFARSGSRSVMCEPVLRQDDVMAMLLLENDLLPGAFTPARLVATELLAAQAAISIENALLMKNERAARSEARFLAEASKTLSESIDYDATIAKVARLAVPSCADWCTIDVLEDSKLRRVGSTHVDPTKTALLGQLHSGLSSLPPTHPILNALTTGKPVVVRHATEAYVREHVQDDARARVLLALGTASFVAVPLIARGEVLGAITLCSDQPFRYGSESLSLAEEIARRGAMAIENARLYRDAQNAVRLRDEFLSLASHELRTPLTSVLLTSQSLRRGNVAAGTDGGRSIADRIERQVRTLARLVDNMLVVSRLLVGRLELRSAPMDLAKVVREEVARVAGGSDELIQVRADTPVLGSWDKEKVAQVVGNLLSNALKFGAGKPVSVAVEQAERVARLTVVDHGIGLDEASTPELFAKFERGVSSRAYGGLGLGLFVVQSIVQAMGGSVRVRSRPAVETRFVVDLPT